MAKTIVGLFDTTNEAQSVVQDLVNGGFNRQDIGLVANNTKGETTTENTGTTTAGESKAGDDAGAGAVGGTVVGGALGLLVGIGALAIPGIGPVVAAGTLATVLGSTALGAGIGAGIGGIVGALVGMGVPKEDAEYYHEGVRRGGTLVTVKSDDKMAQQAYDIMQRHGAADIEARGAEWKQSGYQGYDPNAQPYTATQIDQYRTTPRQTAQTATQTVGQDLKQAAGQVGTTVARGKEAVTGTGTSGQSLQRGVYTVDADDFKTK